ncbi:PREDICTED: exostosin-like 3 [Amphimedon queenslandica]|uniref:glucuronosyl-galactosyl-proteoglycan 4-alpha-N-acetylglucosaminyltransferase n=1 Tax=Amphimedon queenslandica TaxID=400682 RepID=A0A1X7UY07_AMPQE|nr:PREDICTED: exostosin-like 3 [Amphimedon queenslandica]|eukprot:XP_003386458.1 PREDICTED: exostosin-like 3 [Amphimedon queenslandica]
MKRNYRVLLFILFCLLVSTTLIPYLLLDTLSNDPATELPTIISSLPPTARKALDLSNEDERVLKQDINELTRIKHSVRNELRELEAQRVKIVQDTENHKLILFKLQDNIAAARKELQITQHELSKVSHELYSATKAYTPQTIITAPPIVILPRAPFYPVNDKPRSLSKSSHLFTPCSLMKPFKVFLYQNNQKANKEAVEYLKDIDSLTHRKEEACLLVSIDTGANTDEEYNKDDHVHIILTLPYSSPSQSSLSIRREVLTAQSVPSTHWRYGHDIIIPSLVAANDQLWSLVPAYRQYYFYFEGKPVTKYDRDFSLWLQKLTGGTKGDVYIKTNCSTLNITRISGGWGLCGDDKSRSLLLMKSTYSLIVSANNSIVDYIRLSESLAYGSIPVIIGKMDLPFGSILDWNSACVTIPVTEVHEIYYILHRITHDRLLEMRRIGKFFYDTYFSSSVQIIKTVISIMRYRMNHLPPLVTDYQPKRIKTYGIQINHFDSPQFNGSMSVYTYEFWNRPPGPFYMYPHSPAYSPSPVSGSHYPTMSPNELKKLPPHIVQAAGITGPYFQNYLLGDVPGEYFTVVMLTYRREEVVKESIERLNGLDHLAKVIVVWNDPDTSPYTIEWPTLSVPVEVIWCEVNSLNNRFLPFNGIKTEAILSIDDDVYLRHDEIQFAFRVWRESRDRLVGFPGRFHSYDIKHNSWLYNSNYTCELSMVLTGAAFFHKYYSYLYSLWQPVAVRDMVDSKMNCEDIAMNFLIAHVTRKPPLKVTSRWTFRCPNCPEALSQNEAHFNERHSCINSLVKIYGYMPLLYTQYRLDSVLFKTRLPSHLEKCYQYV